MRTKSIPTPPHEDLAADQLVTAVESAIVVMQDRLANLATGGPEAKWSVSDLVRLLQLRTQLQGERPRNITVRWIDSEPELATR